MSAITTATKETSTCEQLLARACLSIAGGDSSTMRVLPYHLPLVAERGRGSRIWDAEGNELIDLNMAYGPLILGHCPPTVVEAVCDQVSRRGSQLGFPTEISARTAEKIQALFPGMELLRFANSGTEAIISATRLARTYTGRSKIVQFEGHYHGWGDPCFHRYHAALSDLCGGDYGPATAGTSGMNGAPHDVLVARWNDIDALHRCLRKHRNSVAAVMMEPVMGNAGVIPPSPGYLEAVRNLTREHEALLIFDEVITGMRIAAGGAQQYYSVQPDITVLSKALGGGYPIAAFGASREIMEPVVDGTMFHGGVYSGNAVVSAAANAVLDTVIESMDEMYTGLHAVADEFVEQAAPLFRDAQVPCVMQNVGPMISMFLTTDPVETITSYRDVRRYCDFDKYTVLQHQMQRSGVYYHPNQFEPLFLSTSHSREDMQIVLDRIEAALAWISP